MRAGRGYAIVVLVANAMRIVFLGVTILPVVANSDSTTLATATEYKDLC